MTKKNKLNKILSLFGVVALCMAIGTVGVFASQAERKNTTQSASGKLMCDTNKSGSVDLIDVNNVLKYALSIVNEFPDPDTYADANYDGTIDLDDVTFALKYALTILPVPTVTENPNATVTPTPTPIVSEDPNGEKVWTLEESVKAYNENLEEVKGLAYELVDGFGAEQPIYTKEEDAAELVQEIKDLCGVTYRVTKSADEYLGMHVKAYMTKVRGYNIIPEWTDRTFYSFKTEAGERLCVYFEYPRSAKKTWTRAESIKAFNAMNYDDVNYLFEQYLGNVMGAWSKGFSSERIKKDANEMLYDVCGVTCQVDNFPFNQSGSDAASAAKGDIHEPYNAGYAVGYGKITKVFRQVGTEGKGWTIFYFDMPQ